MDLYDQISDLYDIWTDADPAGTPCRQFYVERAVAIGGKVLEIGAGSGRITAALAERELQVVALDSSARMIEACARRLASSAIGGSAGVELICCDVLEFHTESLMDLVILPMRTLGHFLTTESRSRLFEKVNSLLRPGGVLIFDHFVAREVATRIRDGLWELVAHRVQPDGVLLLSHCYKADFSRNVLRSVLMVETISDQGVPIRKKVIPYDLAWVEPTEVETLLSCSGFELQHLYGDFSSGVFSPSSEEQVWVVQKVAR